MTSFPARCDVLSGDLAPCRRRGLQLLELQLPDYQVRRS